MRVLMDKHSPHVYMELMRIHNPEGIVIMLQECATELTVGGNVISVSEKELEADYLPIDFD